MFQYYDKRASEYDEIYLHGKCSSAISNSKVYIEETEKLQEIVFEDNMTLALEVWNGRPGGKEGVYIEEDIIVTKDGYELLTKFPVDEITESWI